MGRTSEQVPMDNYACDGVNCEVVNRVEPGASPTGYLLVISPATLNEAAARAYADDMGARELYVCKQGQIGQAVAARVRALNEAAQVAADGQEAAGAGRRSDEEEAAIEDGYDGPMPDDQDADDEDDADNSDSEESAGDGWDEEMADERAAAGSRA